MGSKTDTEGARARAREPNQEKSLKFSHWMNKFFNLVLNWKSCFYLRFGHKLAFLFFFFGYGF